MIRLQTDGAFAPDGLAGAGIVWQQGAKRHTQSVPLTVQDNHAAEFKAAQLGFELLNDAGLKNEIVQFTTDSKAVVTALQKRYSHGYAPELAALLAVTDQFRLVFPKWVPKKTTHQVHELAQQALQRQRDQN
ncbi:reverse transcriptase-like protein [Schleiferilactobacillus perolens]|uniref:RNase H type-1 domain-containing protein n=1 Tax=Schleiferilactobacillus perolens DSM 12744 TaxID=1423792 RepID=A0A0R1N1E1_9LACO|nr:reverse transcriptase-like protein [Schleiferilactobacillus perolens]KRL14064.1 hypothetical protein FD09_GL001224 [Schleiferilactobacillus perolens DSM 12744]